MRLYVIRWTDISDDESYFVGHYSYEKFVFIIETIKADIQPGSTFANDKSYIIDRLTQFNIKEISAKKHILWRFFN
jgi:hypothetical protein